MTPTSAFRSYSSTTVGIRGRLNEAVNLVRAHTAPVAPQVATLLERVRRIEAEVSEKTGVSLKNLDFLEIGPGQGARYLKYFAVQNCAVGIDLDVVVDSLRPGALLAMLRVNGPLRTVKTAARKILGVDRRFDREMCRTLQVANLPKPRLLQMNAEQLAFPDGSFDFVFSCSTFEHLPNPARVLEEIQRVLRPGGVAYIMLHLFTSEGGAHDPRIIADRREAVPLWAHLRPEHEAKVESNSYLNRWRLAEWEELFRQKIPGVHLEHLADPRPERAAALAALRQSGELSQFSDEELLNNELVALWRR